MFKKAKLEKSDFFSILLAFLSEHHCTRATIMRDSCSRIEPQRSRGLANDVQPLSDEDLQTVQNACIDRYLVTKAPYLSGHPRIQCLQPPCLASLDPFQDDAQGYD